MEFEDISQWPEGEQNELITLTLFEYKYLEPFPLPGTHIPVFVHQYLESNFHKGANEYILSKCLVFLMEREYLWPVTFPGTSIKHPRYPDLPFFIRTADIKGLPDCLFNSIEYFDIQEAAKFLMN